MYSVLQLKFEVCGSVTCSLFITSAVEVMFCGYLTWWDRVFALYLLSTGRNPLNFGVYSNQLHIQELFLTLFDIFSFPREQLVDLNGKNKALLGKWYQLVQLDWI